MIKKLVQALPELYQPVYGHQMFSAKASRECLDRLEVINHLHDALERVLQRPLRVLDLGSAQGFFSFHLAERGAVVFGVDYDPKNIELSRALSDEFTDYRVSFKEARIEDEVLKIREGQYDLVLGLSVFHHIVYEKGVPFAKGLIDKILDTCGLLVLELALKEEPVYWAARQPEDSFEIMSGAAFSKELSQFETHLSEVKRPLFFLSNSYLHVNKKIFKFEENKIKPHAVAGRGYGSSRKYYFGSGFFAKFLSYKSCFKRENRLDFNNSKNFLQNPPYGFSVPGLIEFEETDSAGIIVMQKLQGELLLNLVMERRCFDRQQVLLDVLEQLTVLESNGMYHADIRLWNVMAFDGEPFRVIDYGAICHEKKDNVDPENLFLSFFYFVFEVIVGEVINPELRGHFYINPFHLPFPYNKWAVAAWELPIGKMSFRGLYDSLLPQKFNLLVQEDAYNEDKLWSLVLERLHSRALRQESRVGEVEQQLNETFNKEAEAQRKSAALEVAAQLTETRATTLMAELQKSQTELAVLGRELEKANTGLNEKTVALAESEQRNLAIQARLDEAVAKANAARVELSRSFYYQEDLLDKNREMSVEIEKKAHELESTKQDLYAMHWCNHNNLVASQAQQKQLEAHLKTQFEAQLETIYKSTSWRVSAPLRWLKSLILFLLRLPRLLLVTVLRYLIAVLQWPLAHGMRWVARRPRAKRRAVAFLQYLPGMQSQFRDIAYRYGVAAPQKDDFEDGVLRDESVPDEEPVAPAEEVCIEKKAEFDFELSPRAQRVYRDLKVAVEQHDRGNECEL